MAIQSSYRIQINERQRKFILRCLRRALNDAEFARQIAEEPTGDIWPDSNLHELRLLCENFSTLPDTAVSREEIQGFCI